MVYLLPPLYLDTQIISTVLLLRNPKKKTFHLPQPKVF